MSVSTDGLEGSRHAPTDGLAEEPKKEAPSLTMDMLNEIRNYLPLKDRRRIIKTHPERVQQDRNYTTAKYSRKLSRALNECEKEMGLVDEDNQPVTSRMGVAQSKSTSQMTLAVRKRAQEDSGEEEKDTATPRQRKKLKSLRPLCHHLRTTGLKRRRTKSLYV